MMKDKIVKRGAILEISDLKAYFDAPFGLVRAVDGVSLSLPRGSTLGLYF